MLGKFVASFCLFASVVLADCVLDLPSSDRSVPEVRVEKSQNGICEVPVAQPIKDTRQTTPFVPASTESFKVKLKNFSTRPSSANHQHFFTLVAGEVKPSDDSQEEEDNEEEEG